MTHGRAVQASEFGILVEPAEVGQVGQRYDVMVNLPGERSALRVRGVVVYATGKGVGIRFEHVPPGITATLRTAISGQARSGTAS